MNEYLPTYWPVVLGVAVAALLYWLAVRRWHQPVAHFEKKGPLLEVPAIRFFGILHLAVAHRLRILPRVRLNELIEVPQRGKKTEQLQQQVDAGQVDFLLCDPSTLEPKLAIRLDGAHDTSDDGDEADEADSNNNADADRFLHDALASIDLPLLTVSMRRPCGPKQLRRSIRRHIR